MKLSFEATTPQDAVDEICGLLVRRAHQFRKRLYSGKREKEENENIARVLDSIRADLQDVEIVKVKKEALSER